MNDGFPQNGVSLTQTLVGVAYEVLAGGDGRCRIELARFSGKANDIIRTDGAVYLRCLTMRLHDDAGQPTEIIGRLAAVNGHWHIPASEIEVAILIAEGVGGIAGGGYILHLGDVAPQKLSPGTSYQEHSEDTAVGTTAKKFVWKTPGGSWCGIDDSGEFVVAHPNGTRLVFKPTGLEIVVCNDAGISVLFQLSEKGLAFVGAVAGVPKMQVVWDATTGSIDASGLGMFVARFIAGMLGLAPTVPVGYPGGASALPSTSWLVTP